MRRLADVLEAVSGTTSKLQKIDLLAAYLQSLTDEELRIACTHLTGAPFPAGDGRALNVGWSAIADAVLDVSGASGEDLDRSYLAHGDLGSVAAELLTRKVRAPLFPIPLTLTTVNEVFSRLAEARLQLFRPFRFMLADTIFTPAEAFEPVRGDGDGSGPPASLLLEDKYDGVRAQAHYDGTRLAIFSRTLDEITPSFPELQGDLRALAGRYVIDGEVVAWRDGRAIPFTQLQQRLRRKDPSELIAGVPVVLFAFDLLHVDGEDLLDAPLGDRQRRLRALRLGGAVQQANSTVATNPQDLEVRFREARTRGNEGLVVKRPESRYQPGKRGRQWMKLKEELATLDVVVVAAEQGHGKRAGVLSDVTFAVRNSETLAPISKAYSGLTDAEIASLTVWFRAHTVTDRGRVKLVEPKIVLEVAFDAVTRSPRHPSGYALRFPRIKRIRDDKTPDEINTLEDVARIYEYQGSSRGGTSPKLAASRTKL